MLTLIFIISMFVVFGKIFGLALKASWGLAKIIFSVVLLPFILIALVLSGFVMVALPIVVIIGIIALLVPKVG